MSAPTDGNLGPDGRFLPGSELTARYRDMGADGSRGDVVVSCGSGVSATHDALALRIAGLPDALLYPGSYSDWTQQGWPVTTGRNLESRRTRPTVERGLLQVVGARPPLGRAA